MRHFIILILTALCLFFGPLQSQSTGARLDARYRNETLARVLADLRVRYGLSFAYTSNRIPLDKTISLELKNESPEAALEKVAAAAGISVTRVGKQFVLFDGPSAKKPVQKRKAPAKKPLPAPPPAGPKSNASVSLLPVPDLRQNLADDSLSSESELEEAYSRNQESLSRNYVAQLDAAFEKGDTLVLNRLRKEYLSLRSELKEEYRSLKRFYQKIRTDSSSRKPADSSDFRMPAGVQVSVVPGVGTNGLRGDTVTNRLSINILGGNAGGLDGLELGGMLNLDKGNVRGVQVSGFLNRVGGDLEGVQSAGFLNLVGGKAEGVQTAGFMNINHKAGNDRLVQLAGFGNIHQGDLRGVQMAGFLNVNKGGVFGPQVAGFLNITGSPVVGPQIAGFMNLARGSLRGPQVAGFMNVSRGTTDGPQLAGFLNSARNIRGVQVSGFLNTAKKVKGSQIGVFNIADSVSGIQFGVLSFSRKGYRRLELAYGDAFEGTVLFKTGTRTLHNLLSFATPARENPDRWAYGYGFGSELRLGRHLDLNLDLLCQQVIENRSQYAQNLNLLNDLRVTLGVRPWKRTALFAGPVVHVAVSRVKHRETLAIGSPLIPEKTLYDHTEGPTRVAIWPGFTAGIRF